MAKVVERRGLEVEDLGSNFGRLLFFTFINRQHVVIVIFEASDVTTVCPYNPLSSIFKGVLVKGDIFPRLMSEVR